MNYSTQQIDEIRTIIIDLKFKKEGLEELEMDAYDIADSNEDLLDVYNAKITNLKLEIESLEKRLQELVK